MYLMDPVGYCDQLSGEEGTSYLLYLVCCMCTVCNSFDVIGRLYFAVV